MFFSYLFDGGDLKELPNDLAFVILSQDGWLKCTGQNVKLLPMVRSQIRQNIIKGDHFTGCHYFLMSSVLLAGQECAESLLKRLGNEIQHGTTYSTLLSAQRIINSHFEGEIASLIDGISDDDHILNASIFAQIAANYTVLAKFNPRYKAYKVDWQRKSDSYRAVFCREKELATATLS